MCMILGVVTVDLNVRRYRRPLEQLHLDLAVEEAANSWARRRALDQEPVVVRPIDLLVTSCARSQQVLGPRPRGRV